MLFLLIIMSLWYPSCSPTKTVITAKNMPYQSTPIVIDGNAIDWKNVAFNFDPNTLLRYGISNDSSNLYICLTSTSPGVEKKIFHMGMKIYFDTSGERKEACGIQFPMPVDDNALQLINAAGNGNSKTTAEDYRRYIKLQENQYETFGFPGGNGLNAISTTDYISIGFSLDQEDILVYELKIPLTSLYGSPLPSKVYNKALSIGVHIEGIPKSQDPNAPVASEIGMPGSQMTGARINMGKGGGLDRNPYGYSNQTLYKDQRSWFKFTLATK